MQKLYSEFIGMSVLDEYSTHPLALVRDIIIDPENGKILAFLVKQKNVIVPIDVERINRSLIIPDRDRIIPLSDVLRVQTVLQRKIHVIGARVITEKENTYIGRVVDFEIDTIHMCLTRIIVAKVFLFFRYQERIIGFRQIVRIEKHKIIVKDFKEAAVKEKAPARSQAFA